MRTTITGYQDAAEAFVEDLQEQTAPASTAEPFFGDAPGDAWKVVGRSGQRFRGLRQDDLIVRRSGQGWRCMLAEDVGRGELFQPGR